MGKITSRAAQGLLKAIFQPVRAMAFAIARTVGTRRIAHGVEIIDPDAGGQESMRLRCIEQALGLIAASSPGVLLRIQRYVRAIAVAPMGPAFLPDNAYCLLHYHHLDVLAPDRIALQIAHEAAHARLHHFGFSYTAECRNRIEQACVNAEMRLAMRLPNGAMLKEVVERQFQAPWWSDDDIAQRKDEMWKLSGVPLRVRSLLRRLFSG